MKKFKFEYFTVKNNKLVSTGFTTIYAHDEMEAWLKAGNIENVLNGKYVDFQLVK